MMKSALISTSANQQLEATLMLTGAVIWTTENPHLFQVSGGAVSWRSKKQTCVALSTAEAEYVALASAAQEAMWMRQLIAESGNGPPTEATDLRGQSVGHQHD